MYYNMHIQLAKFIFRLTLALHQYTCVRFVVNLLATYILFVFLQTACKISFSDLITVVEGFVYNQQAWSSILSLYF